MMQYSNPNIFTVFLVVITTFGASSGFWTYMTHRRERTSATTKLLMGLAHDKIVTQGMRAIRKGYIETDQYEELRKYLYDPYIELGGNGIVERIMSEVSKLPITAPETTIEKDTA